MRNRAINSDNLSAYQFGGSRVPNGKSWARFLAIASSHCLRKRSGITQGEVGVNSDNLSAYQVGGSRVPNGNRILRFLRRFLRRSSSMTSSRSRLSTGSAAEQSWPWRRLIRTWLARWPRGALGLPGGAERAAHRRPRGGVPGRARLSLHGARARARQGLRCSRQWRSCAARRRVDELETFG